MDLLTHGIVALVHNSKGNFLLLEDSRELMLGYWAPPHGRCESTDKTEEEGIVREVFEETGLRVTPIKKVFTQPADTKVKTVSFWLVDSREEHVRLNEESSSSGWFSIKQALDMKLYPGTKTFFEKVMTGEISLN